MLCPFLFLASLLSHLFDIHVYFLIIFFVKIFLISQDPNQIHLSLSNHLEELHLQCIFSLERYLIPFYSQILQGVGIVQVSICFFSIDFTIFHGEAPYVLSNKGMLGLNISSHSRRIK